MFKRNKFYIVEGVTINVEGQPISKMIGVFIEYEEAQEWTELFAKDYDTVIIHQLHDPDNEGKP